MAASDATLESLFNLYVFTTGRRTFALRQVQRLAGEQGFTELAKHCALALAHETATRELERRWAGEPASADANPEARRIDVLVDRTLSAIRDQAVAQAQGATPGDPIHGVAESLVKRLFPLTVHAVTSLPFVEELAAVDDILKLLNGELAPAVEELALGRLVARLAELAEQYRGALEAPPQSLVAWGRVRAARAEGQGMLLEAVAIIAGRHHRRSRQGTADRLALLAPILKQNDEIAEYLRARRAVADVDPETGEEQPPPIGAAGDGGSGTGNG